jgi:anti-sigma B factor antagonist
MTQITEAAAARVVTPTKNIVASSMDELRKELQAVLESGCRELTIDLKNVEVIDSRGLSLFMLCHNSLSRVGGRLRVVTQNEDLRHLLHVMRLDQHVIVSDRL